MSKISRVDAIEMAISAGFDLERYKSEDEWRDFGEVITRFAELVASQERQACAKICEEESDEWWFANGGFQAAWNCKEKIILRGEE